MYICKVVLPCGKTVTLNRHSCSIGSKEKTFIEEPDEDNPKGTKQIYGKTTGICNFGEDVLFEITLKALTPKAAEILEENNNKLLSKIYKWIGKRAKKE